MQIEAGARFGRVVAIARAPNDLHGNQMWRFRCDCGRDFEGRAAAFVGERNVSCGCERREKLSRGLHLTHRLADSAEYRIWSGMVQRCTNPENTAFGRYGARGIEICPEWLDFEPFLAAVGRRPSPRHTIERIDNSAGYFPGNCRWASRLEQANNRRTNVRVFFRGQQMTLAQAIREVGADPQLAYRRVRDGWSLEDALLLPPLASWNRRRRG